jgi:hypothetical protein
MIKSIVMYFFIFSAALISGVAIFVGLIAFLGGIIYANYKGEQKRLADMAVLANDLDCSFHDKDPYGLGKQLQRFELFVRERSRWVRSRSCRYVMHKTIGNTKVYMFEYAYVVSTGKSAHTVTQTVFFANNNQWFLPDFKLKPETWWHKMTQKLGLNRDINFEENPDFSKRFWLTGEIEELIREKIGPEMQQFLLERPPVHMEGSNYYFVAYKPGRRLNPDEADSFFRNCCKLVKIMEKEGQVELLNLSELQKERAKEIDPLLNELEGS